VLQVVNHHVGEHFAVLDSLFLQRDSFEMNLNFVKRVRQVF